MMGRSRKSQTTGEVWLVPVRLSVGTQGIEVESFSLACIFHPAAPGCLNFTPENTNSKRRSLVCVLASRFGVVLRMSTGESIRGSQLARLGSESTAETSSVLSASRADPGRPRFQGPFGHSWKSLGDIGYVIVFVITKASSSS
jgi:hypothetical protein